MTVNKKYEIVKHYNKTKNGNILFKTEYYHYTPRKGWYEVDLNDHEITDKTSTVIDIIHENFYHKRKSGNIGRTYIKQVWENPNITGGKDLNGSC